MSKNLVDTYIEGIGTVRDCIDCGALIAGGPVRCVRCANEGPPKSKKEQCLLRIMGKGQFLYNRLPMENDQFHVGESYIIPDGRTMLHAKCIDWFQPFGPELTIFIFERITK